MQGISVRSLDRAGGLYFIVGRFVRWRRSQVTRMNVAPRPFFYPLVGPSGRSLTRMGHPGAANHDHHRSIWFAHAKLLGIDFWSDTTTARIRQKEWLCYQDGDEEAAMAVSLGWYDGHDPRELIVQQLVAAVRPGPEGQTFFELQSSFRPVAASLEFGQANFGFLAVRVAKNLSAYFGGGEITNSAGAEGEGAIFGKPAEWMDYSGPTVGQETDAGINLNIEPKRMVARTVGFGQRTGCGSPPYRRAVSILKSNIRS